MSRKRKVTYTLYIEDGDDRHTVDRKLIARRIRSIAIQKNEKMADWADHFGVSRQYISQVVHGQRRPKEIRDFIEERLGERFWSGREAA